MDQTFNTGRKFDEGAIIGEVHHLSGYSRSGNIVLWNKRPGIRSQLFVSKGDPLFLSIVLENLYGNFIPNVEHFGRVIYATPRKIGYVKQSVDSAQVNE